jgi:hypothetical protein
VKHELGAAAYWKLRAICTDAQRAGEAAQHAREAFIVAQQKQRAALTDLGLDPNAQAFALDDDTLTVTFPEVEKVTA